MMDQKPMPDQAQPQAPQADPQALIEQAHSNMGELLTLVQKEAPAQAPKLEALISQFEQLIAEIAQGGPAEKPQGPGAQGQAPVNAGAGGVPVTPAG